MSNDSPGTTKRWFPFAFILAIGVSSAAAVRTAEEESTASLVVGALITCIVIFGLFTLMDRITRAPDEKVTENVGSDDTATSRSQRE